MLEYLGNMILRLIEAELLNHGPALQQMILDYINQFIEMLGKFVSDKQESLAHAG